MPAVVFIAIVRRIVNSRRFETAVRASLGRGADDDLVEASAPVDATETAGRSILGGAVRALLLLTVVTAATWVVGQLVARRMSYGDATSDDFQLVVAMGGSEFHSYAPQLRSAKAITFWSGLLLDLRHASLGPDGADLELRIVMAGVEVRVPSSWRVEVDQSVSAGEFKVDLPGMEELPDDAPTLRIRSTTTIGGGLVTSTRS